MTISRATPPASRPRALTVSLPDGRELVALLGDDGPHHVGISIDTFKGDVRVYVDGHDGRWRWTKGGDK